MVTSILDNANKFSKIDKSNMVAFSIDAAKHYREAARATEKISLNYSNPRNIVVAGMGGSAIGGELLKDWARDKAKIPIEVSRSYLLPAYANENTLVFIMSYSGETEETLSAFLDALKRRCMIFCVSSGGSLIEFAKKINVSHLIVPSNMPPRAALPYLIVPLLKTLEKINIVSGVSQDLSEVIDLLTRIAYENSPRNPLKDNFAKTLALNIKGSAPVIYGFGIYRSVAQRFKQQFNENSKVPSKWDYFSELNHNEIVGWKNNGKLSGCFSTIFIRDKTEPNTIRTRIETTKTLLPSGSKMFEVWAQGKCPLARMLSTVCIGDFTSIYLAVLCGVDPAPVDNIYLLKEKMKQVGMREKLRRELTLLFDSH